jgi:outer membrane protein assembly factor BamA
MKLRALSIILIFTIIHSTTIAQDEESKQTKEEKIKTGWSFGALPVVAFDSDLGFEYGALVNFYNFGDGSRYPKYDHSLYLEVSRYTRGSGIYRLYYDSDRLIKGIRTKLDVAYLPDEKMDFFGFNGYESVYNSDWIDEESDDYRTSAFYSYHRQLFRVSINFTGDLIGDRLKWTAGLAHYNFATGPLRTNKLELPDTNSLYDFYTSPEWGIIPNEEADGGNVQYVKLGTVYDTRDNEPNPMKGVWTELVIRLAPAFLGNEGHGHAKLAFTHRQYFTLIENNLSFAYRLAYQGTLWGDAPWYAQPVLATSMLTGATSQGLGGGKTLRGILRHRVVGDHVAYANFELRWKFVRFMFLKQNWYIGLNAFLDAGTVLKEIDIDYNKLETWLNIDPLNDFEDYFNPGGESLHVSGGAGVRFVMNQNFIIAVDFGKAFNEQDGNTGLYIGLNYLF